MAANTSGVSAQRRTRRAAQAGGDTSAGAARRSARGSRRIPRIDGRAIEQAFSRRGQAEFRAGGLPKQGEASRFVSLGKNAVSGRDIAFESK